MTEVERGGASPLSRFRGVISDDSSHKNIAARTQTKFGHDELYAASEAEEVMFDAHDLGATRGQHVVQAVWDGVTGRGHEGPRIG